jgi:hypothetical protein
MDCCRIESVKIIEETMHTDMKNVSEHLFNLGVGVLAQAQKNVLFTGYDTRIDEGVFGVLQTAQAAELLIKSAIAKQHPLLIFSNVPKSTSVSGELLSVQDIFEDGKTHQYADLPEKLWASTGYKIPNLKTYRNFGKLRNTIQHFAVPSANLRTEAVSFIYDVIDPILEQFWSDYAVNYIDLEDAQDDMFRLIIQHDVIPRHPDVKKL